MVRLYSTGFFCCCCFVGVFFTFQVEVDTAAEKKGKSNAMEKQDWRCKQAGTALVWHWSAGSRSISEQQQQQTSVSEQVSECLGNSTRCLQLSFTYAENASCRQCSGAWTQQCRLGFWNICIESKGLFGRCRETENFVTEAMAFLSLAINWLLQICSAVMLPFFFFPLFLSSPSNYLF